MKFALDDFVMFPPALGVSATRAKRKKYGRQRHHAELGTQQPQWEILPS